MTGEVTRNWFRLVVDCINDLEAWNDWTEEGLRRYWTTVRGIVLLSVFTSAHFPGRVFTRYSEEFVRWAVLWLSDPEGKAVRHV